MATTVSNGSATGAFKICCVCRADVTDRKRMKDSTTGRYWCYECYLAQQHKQSHSGVTMRCPHCHKDFPPLKMVKHGEAYWCETCDASVAGKTGIFASGGAVQSGTKAAAKKPGKLLALVAMVCAGALVYSYFMFWS